MHLEHSSLHSNNRYQPIVFFITKFLDTFLGCGYPPLSVRATVKQLVDQLKLPALGLFDYNVITWINCVTIHVYDTLATWSTDFAHLQVWIYTDGIGKSFLWYKVCFINGVSNIHVGVDVKWLGLHYDDVLGPNTRVTSSVLQNWSAKDDQTFATVMSLAEDQEHPRFVQELHLMHQHRVKAEIESLNVETFDALETLIIQKTLRKAYI